MFVFVQPTLADLPTRPDPPDRTASGMPRLTLLLVLVRTLIGIGKGLAGTIQDRATRPGATNLLVRFGTADLRQVMLRLIRGLHIAAALEQRLTRRAATGRDITPAPMPPQPPLLPAPRIPPPPDLVPVAAGPP